MISNQSMSSEKLQSVSFSEDVVSPFLELVKLTFTQDSRKRSYDIALRHGSVAILLYHTELKKFLFVRQFRPAVLVGHVLRQPENFGKQLDQINWSNYDACHGYTLELCAGMIDKDLPTISIAKEEIEEECGYLVSDEKIHAVATFSVATHHSGSIQYLFYAEIDDSMKVSEGGGNIHEGEVITKVFLTEDEVLASLNSDNYCSGSPTMLYALLWWFVYKKGQDRISSMVNNTKHSTYKWQVKNVIALKDFNFQKTSFSEGFVIRRMYFTLGTITRSWDLALCDDSVSILLLNKSTNELVLTQIFRPAALVGQVRHRSPSNIELGMIDWPSQPAEWAYTLEMCSGHYRTGSSVEEIEVRAKEIAAVKCGYRVDSISFVISYIVGISFSGSRERVYYAEVDNSMQIPGWIPCEDITPFFLPCGEISSFIRAKVPTGPPSVLYMLQWFLNNRKY